MEVGEQKSHILRNGSFIVIECHSETKYEVYNIVVDDVRWSKEFKTLQEAMAEYHRFDQE